MRILWFANTPSLATDYLHDNSQGGGWIISLEQEIAKLEEIQLGVAFHHDSLAIKHFEIEGTSYFNLPNYKAKGKIKRWWERWTNRIEPKCVIADYLKVIEQFKPDLIHIFGTEQAFGLLIENTKIPVVVQIQGNLNVIKKKWFGGFGDFDIFRYSNIFLFIHAYSLWHDYFLLAKKAKRELIVFKNCKFFLGRTEWDKRITKALSDNGKYFHCDEIMRKEFYSNQWFNPQKPNIILFSTLNPSLYKGLDMILNVASLLKSKLKQNIEWRIAGITNDDEIVKITEKSLKKKFDLNNIFFLGSLDAKSLINNLLQSNCYIHTSHIENSPNSVCEAMLLGMPVIATYAGGTPSIIQNGENGILVQSGDPFVLTGAILEILENHDFAIQLGENARKKSLLRHDPKVVSLDLLDIYNHILEDNSYILQ